MINVMVLAQYILYTCMEQDNPISNLKLQKILYFLQGEHLAKMGEPLFDADFEAWQYGPVVRNVYSKYCGYGATDIIMVNKPNEMPEQEVCSFVDPIVKKLCVLDAWELVDKTHTEGGAWDQIYQNGKGKNYVIPQKKIKDEFKLKMKEAE